MLHPLIQRAPREWQLCIRWLGPLTAMHGALIAAFCIGALVFLDTPLMAVIAGMLIGLMFWTFSEYVLHRWVLHPPAHKRSRDFADHTFHHRCPCNIREFIYSLKLTLPVAVGLAGLCAGLSFALLHAVGPGLAVASGTALGYVCYEWTHMGSHMPMIVRRRIHQQQWRPHPHHWHHYHSARYNFGITTTLWDHVFGTYKTYPCRKTF